MASKKHSQPPSKQKLPPKLLSCQRNGSKGGRAAAAKHDADWREERSRRAGLACAAKYGSDFYKHIRNTTAQLQGIAKYNLKKRREKKQEEAWQKDPAIKNLLTVAKKPIPKLVSNRMAQ